MKKFENKVVLITGASSGIGAALALEFAKGGAHLVLAARREDRLKDLVKDLRAFPIKALPVVCDVTDGDKQLEMVRLARETFGKIDVVIANAGFSAAGLFKTRSLEDYRKQFETNVFGVLRTISTTLPDLEKSKGILVLMGSMCGHLSAPEASPYSMTKFAIRALAQSLYAELATAGIGVVLISPGFVESEIYTPGTIPGWLKMPTQKAARKMLKAIARRKRERIITIHAWWLCFLDRCFPGLLPRIFKFVQMKRPPL
jgi:short-subunit dehydrogenase